MSNVIILYGNDEFAIARKLRELEADFPDPTTASMNITRLEARTASDNDLNTAVSSMPFLAPKRLVILANPSARYTKPAERKKFEELLGAVPDSSRLVVHENIEAREADKHWLLKWAAKAGVKAQAFMLPRLKDMPGWMVNEAKKQGGALEPAAGVKLAEMVGTDTRQAGMEIAKLLALVNWSRPITLADVESAGIASAEADIFEMVDALANSNPGLAQKTLHRLLEDKDAFELWGMVIRQFRLMLLAREVIDAHGMVQDVQEALRVHPFVAEKVYGQAKRFTLARLEGIYRRLLVIDEAAKTGRMPLDLSLDMFIGEETGKGGERDRRSEIR
jgi:DNA polymerase-3 subunit delta